MSNTVAIVGRPNVGKSSFFNRIIGQFKSIVADEEGITRDRIYGRSEWLTRKLNVIDTGGMSLKDADFQAEINLQVTVAIEESDLVLFLVDGISDLVEDDYYIAERLRQANKEVIVVVNKIDDPSKIENIYNFYELGFEHVMPASVIHSIGMGDVLDKTIELLSTTQIEKDKDEISFAIIGRPNVGKSTLVNTILKEQRVITSDVAGSTRDSVDTPFKYYGQKYRIIDTAGIRKKGKIIDSIEKFSYLRAIKAVDEADIVVVLLEADQPIIEQDKRILGIAFEQQKPIIVVLNKYDLIGNKHNFEKIVNEYKEKVPFLSYAFFEYISAKDNLRVTNLMEKVKTVYDNSQIKVNTKLLNDVIGQAQLRNPAPNFNSGRLKIYYAKQVANNPVTLLLFCNSPEFVHFSYKRYIENTLRDNFYFDGIPLSIKFRRSE
jgi:GTP-binding protein